MADQKLIDLTATTTPAVTDLAYIVVDPSGTPLDRKVTLANILALAPSLLVESGTGTKISALTADTTPTTDDLIPTINDPGGTPANKKVTIGNLIKYPCLVHFSFGDTGGFNPADGTTYFFGDNISFDPSTTAAFFLVTMPRAGVAKKVYANFQVAGVLASAGNSTISLKNITAVTSEVISNAVAFTGTPTRFNNTAMTLAFSAGDELEISWLTPTWATNPTVMYGQLDLLVEFSY